MRGSSCSGSSPSLESKRVLDLPPGVGGMPKATGIAGAAGGLAHEARGHAGRALPAADGAVGGEEVRLRPRQVRPRAGRFDHRRPLPRAGPHAGAQRTDRARVPGVGDVRQPASEGHVQDLRGRGRHRRHVLHLQVAEGQSHPQSGRHDRARRADLHAVPRDGAPRGLRPPLRPDPRQAGEEVPVSGRGAREAPRSEDQGVLRRQPGQPVRGGDCHRPPSRRSAPSSRSGPI